MGSRLATAGAMNRIDRIEFAGLEWQTPFGRARVARVVLRGIVATAAFDGVTVDELRLEGVSVDVVDLSPPAPHVGEPWRFEPAAGADGELRAHITDAAWVLDADVTVPIDGGRIDFDAATVEHIGPDSSMGVSPTGVYVDTASGRRPLFVWSAAPVPGVRFEQRGGMSAQATRRGSLDLRPLIEAVLAGVPVGAAAAGARTLLARTRVGGRLRLGDGIVGNERQRLTLSGRAEGRNRVDLSPTPSGQGVSLRITELSAADLRLEAAGRVVRATTLNASLAVHWKDPGGTAGAEVQLAEATLTGLAVRPLQPGPSS